MKITNLTIKLNKSIANINVANDLSNAVKQILFNAIIQVNDTKCSNPDFDIYSSNNEYIISGKKITTQKFKNIELLLYNIEWQIVDFLIEQQKNILQFHAASLSYKNDGYLFIGNPGTGKTSISIALLKKGFSYLSDEVGLLSLQNKLYPFPRNMIIKPHLRNIIDIPSNSYNLYIDRDEKGKELANFLSPLLFGKIETRESVPLKKIFFLESIKKPEYNIEKIGQYSIFNKMLQQLFNPERFRDLPEKIISIFSNTSCFKLTIGKPLIFTEKQSQNFAKILVEIS